jgi:hypothetical protein
MARIVDFTRERYKGFRRGMNEDRRQINTELRQIRNQYLTPQVIVPAAGGVLKGGMDIGKGLLQRAAKSRATAGMTDKARTAYEQAGQKFDETSKHLGAIDTQRKLWAASREKLEGPMSLQQKMEGRDDPEYRRVRNLLGAATTGKDISPHLRRPGTTATVGAVRDRERDLRTARAAEEGYATRYNEMTAEYNKAGLAAQAAEQRLRDLEGIQQYGDRYLQQEAQLANTEERQRELLSLVTMTQGPQYQGRSLGQIAAGAAPDASQIVQRQKLMASMFPATAAQIDAQKLKRREKEAGIEKTEASTGKLKAETTGLGIKNEVERAKGALSQLKDVFNAEVFKNNPETRPLMSGLEKLVNEADLTKANILDTRGKTLGRFSDMDVDRREIDLKERREAARQAEFLLKSQDEKEKFDREMRLKEQKRRDARAKGRGPKTPRSFKQAPVELRKAMSSLTELSVYNPQVIKLIAEYKGKKPGTRDKALEGPWASIDPSLDWSVNVIAAMGLGKELNVYKRDEDAAAYKAAAKSIAMRVLHDHNRYAIEARSALEGMDIAVTQPLQQISRFIREIESQYRTTYNRRETLKPENLGRPLTESEQEEKDNLNRGWDEMIDIIGRVRNHDYTLIPAWYQMAKDRAGPKDLRRLKSRLKI